MDRVKEGKVAPVIRAEQAVFRAWIREGHQGVYRFSRTLSVGDREAGLDLTPIKESLHQLIESQDQLQDIIVALWENGAVVTKASNSISIAIRSNTRLISGRVNGSPVEKSDRSGSLLPFSLARCHLNGINREFCATCTKLFFFFVRLAIDL